MSSESIRDFIPPAAEMRSESTDNACAIEEPLLTVSQIRTICIVETEMELIGTCHFGFGACLLSEIGALAL
jgi:hypothetical protein